MKAKDFIEKVFSEDAKVSLMRVMSALMFIEATIFLFTKVRMLELTWMGVVLVALLYGLAFFPKVMQKKYEQLNILNDKLEEIKKAKEEKNP